MKQKIYILGIVSAMVLITGTMFKVQHWPAAAILICAGTILLLAVFLPAALINHYKANGNKQYKLLYITIYVTCFVVFTAMLFKIQHWPFAGYAVLIGVPFPFVVFLPVWLYETSIIKNFDIYNTIYILFLLALQAVFSVLLAMNVTKEKIDNTLQMTNQLLASATASPAEKLNSELNSFISELAKLPDGQNIAKEAQDLFDLTNEPGDETPWHFKVFQGVYFTWILVELDGIETFVRVIKS